MIRAALWLLTLLIVIAALAWIFQRRLMYLPSSAGLPRASEVIAGAQDVTIETSDGLELGAWFVPAPARSRARPYSSQRATQGTGPCGHRWRKLWSTGESRCSFSTTGAMRGIRGAHRRRDREGLRAPPLPGAGEAHRRRISPLLR
jgi:hypothetical protein